MNNNTRSIGDIASNGGFPKAIDTVFTTGKSLVITKGGKPVVAMIPCSESTSVYLQHKERLDGMLEFLVGKNENVSDDIQEFLMYQVSMGAYAKSILLGVSERSSELVMKITELENKLLHRFGERFQKSSAQDKALSSHDNLSGVVPKVKQEGLPIDGSPSVSRKRGRPRKTEVSPL